MSEWPSLKNLQTINPGKDVEKREPSYIAGRNAKWYSHYAIVWRFLRKLKTDLPYHLAIPSLGMYWKKTVIQKDTCIPMFIAALFTTANTWKQPKCPSTVKWIKKMWCTHTHTYI